MQHACEKAFSLLASCFDAETLERISKLERVKARFLETERDHTFAKRFEWLLTNLAMRADPDKPFGPGNRREARCLVVVGRSGAGKTRMLTRAFDKHPTFPGYGDPGSDCRMVTVSLPSPCTLLQLGRQILAAIGYPLDRQLKEHLVWERVFFRLEFRGMLVLHLDELHNVLRTANVLDIDRIRKTFKTLLVHRRWPVGLVVSGLPEIAGFLETLSMEELDENGELVPLQVKPEDHETELRRRCRVIELEPLSLPGDLGMLTEAAGDVARLGGLSFPPNFKEQVAPRLVHASLYELGTCMELLTETVEEALTPDTDMEGRSPVPDRIVAIRHFAKLYAARTGCSPGANPFLVPDWWTVDCTKVLRKSNERDPAPRSAKATKTRKQKGARR